VLWSSPCFPTCAQWCESKTAPTVCCWLQQSRAQSPHCWVSKRAEPTQGNRVVGSPRLDLKPRAAGCGYALHHLHFHSLLILNFPPLSMRCLAPPSSFPQGNAGPRCGRLAWGPLQLISRVAMTKVTQLFLFPSFLELLKISYDSRRNSRVYVRAFFYILASCCRDSQGCNDKACHLGAPELGWPVLALHPSPSQQGSEGICWDTSGTQHCGPLCLLKRLLRGTRNAGSQGRLQEMACSALLLTTWGQKQKGVEQARSFLKQAQAPELS